MNSAAKRNILEVMIPGSLAPRLRLAKGLTFLSQFLTSILLNRKEEGLAQYARDVNKPHNLHHTPP